MKPDTFLTEKTFSFNGSNNHVYLVDAETHEKNRDTPSITRVKHIY